MPDPGAPHDPDVDADDTPASADESAADESPTDEPVPFQNRAARRARTAGAKQQQTHGKSKQFGGRGSAQGPRQWANRRSG